MDVDVVPGEDIGLEAELARARSDVAERGLGGLFHDVAQVAGQSQGALALHDGRFDVDDVPADLGPGEPCGHPDDVLLFLAFLVVPGHAEVLGDGHRRNGVETVLALRDLLDDLAHHVGDFALEVPDAGLARVVRNNPTERPIGEGDLLLGDAVLGQLAGNQEPLGDADFFLLRVPGDLDDLHAVAQG